MRFRSGRFWSGIGSSALIFALGGLAALCPRTSRATVVINPSSGPLGIFAGNTVYYPAYYGSVIPLSTTNTQLIPGASALDFSQFQYQTNASTGQPNYPTLNVTWTTSGTPPTSSTGFMLVVTMTGTITGSASGGSSSEVPAATLGACPGSGCLTNTAQYKVTSTPASGAAAPSTTSIVTNSYYGAYGIVAGQTLALSLDFRTMCDAFSTLNGGGSNVGTGCTTLIVNPAASTPPTPVFTTVTLNFGIYAQPACGPNNNCTEPVWNNTMPIVDQSGPINFDFSSGPSSQATTTALPFTCGMSSAYYPGDSQIIVNGTAFSYTSTSSPPDALTSVIVVGAVASASSSNPVITPLEPTVTNFVTGHDPNYPGSAYPQAYPIQQLIPPQPAQDVAGFTNSTSLTDAVYYAVGFLGEDNYQFLVQGSDGIPLGGSASSPAGTCAFGTAVQTASIETFLNASKCFIATATFRRMDSPPLVLLRAFRDQFLEHFALGKDFVHWYYAWSPLPAEWLIANPVFRFPIFLALMPLQILAWLVLHPLALTFLLMTALSVLSYGVSFRLRGRFREDEELRG